MVRLHYGKQIAPSLPYFFPINGIFVGLTRIVQYQSFLLLFSCLALYAFFSRILGQPVEKLGEFTPGYSFGRWLYSPITMVFLSRHSPYTALLLSLKISGAFNGCKTLAARPSSRPGSRAAPGDLLPAPFYCLFRSDPGPTGGVEFSGNVNATLVPSSVVTFRLYNPFETVFLYAGLILLSLGWGREVLPVWCWMAFPWVIF